MHKWVARTSVVVRGLSTISKRKAADPAEREGLRYVAHRYSGGNRVDFKGGSIRRREMLMALSLLAPARTLRGSNSSLSPLTFHNPFFEISLVGSTDCLWSYRPVSSAKEYRIAPSVFNIDSRSYSASLKNLRPSRAPVRLRNGAVEYEYEGAFIGHPDLSLGLLFQFAEDNPIVRFSYILKSRRTHALTKPSGHDELIYLRTSFDGLEEAKEVRFANFLELVHSYTMEEVILEPPAFADGLSAMGPMLVGSSGRESMLVAYEHGSQIPDAFLSFQLSHVRSLTLRAIKGNYSSGQPLDAEHPYPTVWFQMGALSGSEEQLASAFRAFMLKYATQNLATRKPLIYYNTWNMQERNKGWYGKGYATSLNPERILEEIEVAHRIGIDVYVIDGGWFDKAGAWTVNLARFPDDLQRVKDRLDSYGMKLGLWFGPNNVAASTQAFRGYADCLTTWHGKKQRELGWEEAPQTYSMCLVSRYTDAFAERLVQLSKELGVTYFKWDAISQYGCDSPNHWHGDKHNTAQERSESYGFQLVQQLTRMANKIAAACPEAIVDFDVTESGRAVGLAFLSAGRFFLINNGPYYSSFNIPIHPGSQNVNVFFYPGPARTWICRTPLTYDKWIPSILFLTHYFPDDPRESQEINIASLILGQNGLWGDLPRVSDTGVRFLAETLARYKQVWDDMAASDPLVVGRVSGSPEIHEKIQGKTGRGAVVAFATSSGKYEYVTAHRVSSKYWASEGVEIHFDPTGRARLDLNFSKAGAKIVLFGVQ